MLSVEQFKDEVNGWAKELGAEPKEIHVREMKHKWGSCSSEGRLTFDVDLLREGEPDRKRVIVEELLHLKYPNHGRMFRALLNAYLERNRRGGSSTSAPTGSARSDSRPARSRSRAAR